MDNKKTTIAGEVERLGNEVRQLHEQLSQITGHLQEIKKTQKVVLSCSLLPNEVKGAIGEKDLLELVQGLLQQAV